MRIIPNLLKKGEVSKMKQEKSLSDDINDGGNYRGVEVWKIKEAVGKLKEEMRKEGYKETADDIDKIIDKIFGPKLTEKGEGAKK